MIATDPQPTDTLVEATDLSKCYKIYPKPMGRLTEWLTFGKACRHDDFWALRNVHLKIQRGECCGIIGPNGSGKSTMLKILTGVSTPTTGTVAIRGRLLSLLELGTGINPQLTGRQNVISSAQLLAFPPGFAEEKMDEIREFSELGDFFDRPMRMYSSGMGLRLAFSMFACFRPEVFVVDEALSVGDIHFQQKCVTRIEEMRAAGTTFLFVSHDMNAIRRLCNQAMVLSRGEVVFAGAPDEAVSRYYTICGSSPSRNAPAPVKPAVNHEAAAIARAEVLAHDILPSGRGRHGAGELRLVAATIQDEHQKYSLVIESLQSATVTMLIRAHCDIPNGSAGIHIFDRLNNLVYASGLRQLRVDLPALAAGAEAIVRLKIQMNLQPGEYTFSLGCSEPSQENINLGHIQDRVEGLGPLVIAATPDPLPSFYGITMLPTVATIHAAS